MQIGIYKTPRTTKTQQRFRFNYRGKLSLSESIPVIESKMLLNGRDTNTRREPRGLVRRQMRRRRRRREGTEQEEKKDCRYH
jgi:hypothetical protein